MGKKASFRADFKVAETKGRFAEGKDSPLALNNQIVAIADPKRSSEVFEPMWHLCLICANQRRLIAKVRGDSNDFLNYATLGYVQRWKKQFEKHDKRIAVSQIQNWIPYILNTIRFALMSFNKQAYDYDFLPLPRLLLDKEDDAVVTRDVLDVTAPAPSDRAILSAYADKEVVHTVLLSLPLELYPYLPDILFYIRTKGKLLSKKNRNFVIIGRNIFLQELRRQLA